jgi:hypothetical protein
LGIAKIADLREISQEDRVPSLRSGNKELPRSEKISKSKKFLFQASSHAIQRGNLSLRLNWQV